MWRKYFRMKKRRSLPSYLCILIILLILYCCRMIRIDLLSSNYNNPIDLKRLSSKLKENYKELFGQERNESLKKGLLIVSDKSTQLKYNQLSAALRCYSIVHGYSFEEIDPDSYPLCLQITNFFFQKHCVVLFYLIENLHIGWLMVLDGDNILVNQSKQIEDYLPNLPNIYLIHSERFYNGEISAGNYLIYNCQWSYLYLFNWIKMYQILPSVPYHNNDNGALHLHFALSIGKFSLDCLNLWYRSINENIYDQYVGCIKCLLKGQRQFKHIWLLRRGHAFTRDYREPPNSILFNDFLIHGFKNDSSHYYQTKINRNLCEKNINQWLLPVRKEMIIFNVTIAKELIRFHDLDAEEKHRDSIGIADVFDCWPSCQSNITNEKEKVYLNALCRKWNNKTEEINL